MDRRDFLRKYGGIAAGFFAALAGCAKEKPVAVAPGEQRGAEAPAPGTEVVQDGERAAEQPQPAKAEAREKAAGAAKPNGEKPKPELADPKPQASPDLVVAGGGNPAQLVEKALEALGGIKKFVRPGSKVVLKPNIGWYRTPEQAANTNPDLVAAVVRLCLGAGAKSVTVVEHTRDPWQACFQASGIKKAVEDAGGRIYAATRKEMFTEVPVRRGKAIDRELVASDVLQADVLINLPVTKVHDATGAVIGMKNLMGTIWNPPGYHLNLKGGLNQCIADLNTVVKPQLIIADCYRVLLTGGPKGPGKVGNPGKVVAGTDPVAVDSYCLRFLNLKVDDVPHIKLAHEAGLGEMDLSRLQITSVSV